MAGEEVPFTAQSGGYADVPFNTTTHLLWFFGAEPTPDADPRYTWTSRGKGWWEGVLKGGVPTGPSGESPVTGVNPVETSYSLYGHTIPLSVFGLGRIGGEIIAGPWVDTDSGTASFCISFGVPADPSGSRTLKEIAFDSEVMWTAADGYSNEDHFTFRWYEGTLTQAADSLEIANFGADAVAYRPQMLLWFEDLQLEKTKFKKIPYVAALISDDSGEDVNLGEAFERLAYSPWVGFTPDQFATAGVTDGLPNGGMIIVEQADFLSTIQQFGRFYKNWDILQTDKLRIVDHGNNVTADVVLGKNQLTNNIVYSRAEANTTSRELTLSTIDNTADYTIVPSTAKRPLEPVAVTASVRTESGYLPIITDPHTRQALVTYTKYQEEVTRKQISGTAMMYGLELEPGDRIGLTGLGPDFANEVFKVVQTTHGANYVVEFSAESLFNCDAGIGDPWWNYVVLLMGYEDVDGSTGAPGLTDESPKHHGTGDATGTEIDTAQSKFGSSSLRATGQLLFLNSTDWHLSSANSDQFTIESWVRVNSFPTGSNPGAIVGHGTSSVSWYFAILSNQELRFIFKPSPGGTNIITDTSGVALALGVWYHLAVDKDAAGKIRIYVNGVMRASATPVDSSFFIVTDGLDIGAIGLFGAGAIDGWLDELRITKGIARYKTDGSFPVPASAFPRGEAL